MSDAVRKGKAASIQVSSEQIGGYYVVRLKEQLSPDWLEMYEGLTLTYAPNGETILTGFIKDQSGLHGLLARIRDLNLTLISVCRSSSEEICEEKSKEV